MTFDPKGDLYVTDVSGPFNRVHQFGPDGDPRPDDRRGRPVQLPERGRRRRRREPLRDRQQRRPAPRLRPVRPAGSRSSSVARRRATSAFRGAPRSTTAAGSTSSTPRPRASSSTTSSQANERAPEVHRAVRDRGDAGRSLPVPERRRRRQPGTDLRHRLAQQPGPGLDLLRWRQRPDQQPREGSQRTTRVARRTGVHRNSLQPQKGGKAVRRLALLFAGGAVWLFLAAIPVLADGGPHVAAINSGVNGGLTADSCAGCHRAHTAQGATAPQVGRGDPLPDLPRRDGDRRDHERRERRPVQAGRIADRRPRQRHPRRPSQRWLRHRGDRLRQRRPGGLHLGHQPYARTPRSRSGSTAPVPSPVRP